MTSVIHNYHPFAVAMRTGIDSSDKQESSTELNNGDLGSTPCGMGRLTFGKQTQKAKQKDHFGHQQKDNDSPGESTGEEEDGSNLQFVTQPTQTWDMQHRTIELIKLSRTELAFHRRLVLPGGKEFLELRVELLTLPKGLLGTPIILSVRAFDNASSSKSIQPAFFSFREEYEEELRVDSKYTINPGGSVLLKIAVTGPETKQPMQLKGSIALQLNRFEPMTLPIEMNCEIPRITNGKELFSANNGINVLKIPVRKNVKIAPLQFKNHSQTSLSMEVELVGPPSGDLTEQQAYRLQAQTAVNTLGSSSFSINLQLMVNEDFEGKLPETQVIRRILILKVKNSSVHYYFPLEAFVFESSYVGSVLYT